MIKLLGQYRTYLNKSNLHKNTVTAYLSDVEKFADYLYEKRIKNVKKADKKVINAFLTRLQKEGKSQATIARTLASIRFFYDYLISQDLTS